jgi:hypothetical protein
MYESLEYKIWIFKMTLSRETTKTKVVVLQKF